MKIIFYRYGSICEPDILEVFKKLNIKIYEDTLEMKEKHATPSARIKHLAESCRKASETGKPDFIFSLNFFPYVSEFCEKFGILYVCWSVDCPVLELFSTSIRNKCNRIFLFDEIQYQEVYPHNPEGIFYLPLATSVERWDRELEVLKEKDQKEYGADISFVGSLYHEKSPLSMLNQRLLLPEYLQGYIQGVSRAQLLIYGSNFLQEMVTQELICGLKQAYPDFYSLKSAVVDTDVYVAANYYLGMLVSEMERIEVLNALAQKHKVTVFTRSNTSLLRNIDCREGVTTHVQMPRIFRLSKINLNITMKGIQSGLPLRIWDVLGCGGFLLTNYQAEIPSYFDIDKDLVCYEGIEDCVEKAHYYLCHSDIRMKIADNGYRKVKALHTYEHRIAAILKVLYPEI
mgnify:CR=1 FL=1